MEVEQETQVAEVAEEEAEVQEGDSTSLQSERREEGRATAELLLDWIAVPGSYSRWWLLKDEEEKEPLCGEINLFLRSHGLRGMSGADIRQQLSTFVMTFQAAHTWLRQTRVEYPAEVEEMTLEQEGIKSHVRHMCPHYERLAPVLAAYVDYDDSAVDAAQGSEVPATATVEAATQVSSEVATQVSKEAATQERSEAQVSSGAATQVSSEVASRSKVGDVDDAADTPPRPAKKPRRQSTGSTAAAAAAAEDDSEDEAKAQKRRLFELECARLQSEIETRNVQLVLEKTLARKKLLDAGISAEEVDRIFPL